MSENPINSLGEVIKREREKLALSIDDISSATGIPSTYIERVEEMHILIPYPEYINILSGVLGVDLQYLQNDLLGERNKVQIKKDSHIDSDKATANSSLESLRNLKIKKERVEDTHTRHTFLIHNDLLERLEKHAQDKWGFMKEFINPAIEFALDELDKNE